MANPMVQTCLWCGGTGEVFATVNGKRTVVQCPGCSGHKRVVSVPDNSIVVADDTGRVADAKLMSRREAENEVYRLFNLDPKYRNALIANIDNVDPATYNACQAVITALSTGTQERRKKWLAAVVNLVLDSATQEAPDGE